MPTGRPGPQHEQFLFLGLSAQGIGAGSRRLGGLCFHPMGDTSLKKSSGHLKRLPPRLAPRPEDALHLLRGASPRWARQGSPGGCQLPRDSSLHQMGFTCPPPAPVVSGLGVCFGGAYVRRRPRTDLGVSVREAGHEP